MNVRIITIEREYGSGGTVIARRTADRCGIPCYGREILEQVALQQQVSLRSLEDYEERISGSLLYSMFVMSQSQTGDPDLLSQEAKLYVAESRVIRELARSGPAIFVGHCACKALEQEPGLLRVFIHGSEADKRRRITEDYGIPSDQVAAACHRINRRRSGYYSFCTGKKWMDPDGYDLMLDSSALGTDACADLLSTLWTRSHTDGASFSGEKL